MTVLRIVLRGRGLRRVVAAFLGFKLADWARWLAIERDDFLEAVTGQLAGRQRAEDLVTERLGA